MAGLNSNLNLRFVSFYGLHETQDPEINIPQELDAFLYSVPSIEILRMDPRFIPLHKRPFLPPNVKRLGMQSNYMTNSGNPVLMEGRFATFFFGREQQS